MATPLLIDASPWLANLALRLPWPARLPIGSLASETAPALRDHVVIIGFGLVGRHIAEAAEAVKIPYVVLEANPETVRRERARGRPIFHADATQDEALKHAGIRAARLVVVATGEPAGTRRIVDRVRRLSPTIYIMARTRYYSELEELRDLGADDVIPEEYETSIEIFTRVLQHYLVPEEEVAAFAKQIRASGYASRARGPKAARSPSSTFAAPTGSWSWRFAVKRRGSSFRMVMNVSGPETRSCCSAWRSCCRSHTRSSARHGRAERVLPGRSTFVLPCQPPRKGETIGGNAMPERRNRLRRSAPVIEDWRSEGLR
jgi:voltage-gated potassium channel Kch